MIERSVNTGSRDRVALVTGVGNKRVGWHVALALAERGYNLVLQHRRDLTDGAARAAELNRSGVQALFLRADLSKESDVDQLMSRMQETFSGIDVLVNCASTWQRKSLEETRAADVQQHFESNILSTFLLSRAVGLVMAQQVTGGVIINFGDWAETRPYRNYSAYFATKGAVPCLTRTLAVELAARNPRVRVNCILPGPIMMPEEIPRQERARVIEATLVKREGSPHHAAQAAIALIENEFITGASLTVDGGRTIHGS